MTIIANDFVPIVRAFPLTEAAERNARDLDANIFTA